MKKSRKRVLYILILCLICSMTLLACGEKPADEQGKAAQETQPITISLVGGDWGFPDPFAHQPRDWGGVYTMLIFDSLLEEDESGTIPWLATDWNIENDGQTYTFDLRKEVKWNDGEDFTADDVVFTFEYYQEKNHLYDLSSISSIKKNGDYQVKVELKEPSVVAESRIFQTVPIIPQHIWQNVEDPKQFHVTEPEKAAVATGPYKLADYQQEHGSYKFIANDEFWGGSPRVSEIITVPCSESALSLLNGEIAITMISPQEIEMFKDKEEFVIEELKPYHHKWLCFNLNDSDLADVEFRHALAYAIDKNELLERMYMGVGNPGAQGGIPMVHPMYNPNIEKYDYAPENAIDILDDLGYEDINNDGIRENKNGDPLKFKILVMSQNARAAELVQIHLKKVGIDTEIMSNERGAVDKMTAEGKFQIVLQKGGYGGLSGDPDFLRRNFNPGSNTYHNFSSFGYNNPEFNELADKQQAELDAEKRKAMIFEMQEILAEDIPIYYLYGQGGYYVYNKNIYDGWFWPAYTPLLDRSKLQYCRGAAN